MNCNSCDKMSKPTENCIREAIKNIKEKKRKKCNLAAIKKYLEDESSLPIDLELQLNEMVRRGLINKEETYSLGSACKGATAAPMLEYNDENVMGECNVKHNIPEIATLSQRIQILESKLDGTTQLHCSLQTSSHPIDPVITRLEKEVEFLKQEILVKNKQISSLIDSSKCKKIHGDSSNGYSLIDADKVGRNVSHSDQSQAEKATPMGRRLALDNFTVTTRRRMPQIPDMGNKCLQERQRNIVPGELTYAESTKGKHAISDGTKKVDDTPVLLSMKEYPALYNRYSPLSTGENSSTHNVEGVEKEDIDDRESGLSKQAVLLNRQRRSAAENQKQSRRYTKPTTVVLAWRLDSKEHKRL